MLKPSVEQMLEVGLACGLTTVIEAYQNYVDHYELFFDMSIFSQQLLVLQSNMRGIDMLQGIEETLKIIKKKT